MRGHLDNAMIPGGAAVRTQGALRGTSVTFAPVPAIRTAPPRCKASGDTVPCQEEPVLPMPCSWRAAPRVSGGTALALASAPATPPGSHPALRGPRKYRSVSRRGMPPAGGRRQDGGGGRPGRTRIPHQRHAKSCSLVRCLRSTPALTRGWPRRPGVSGSPDVELRGAPYPGVTRRVGSRWSRSYRCRPESTPA